MSHIEKIATGPSHNCCAKKSRKTKKAVKPKKATTRELKVKYMAARTATATPDAPVHAFSEFSRQKFLDFIYHEYGMLHLLHEIVEDLPDVWFNLQIHSDDWLDQWAKLDTSDECIEDDTCLCDTHDVYHLECEEEDCKLGYPHFRAVKLEPSDFEGEIDPDFDENGELKPFENEDGRMITRFPCLNKKDIINCPGTARRIIHSRDFMVRKYYYRFVKHTVEKGVLVEKN